MSCSIDNPKKCLECEASATNCTVTSSIHTINDDKTSWTDSEGDPITVTYCGATTNDILGGYNNVPLKHMKKDFNLGGNLYNKFLISFRLFTIDKWRWKYL